VGKVDHALPLRRRRRGRRERDFENEVVIASEGVVRVLEARGALRDGRHDDIAVASEAVVGVPQAFAVVRDGGQHGFAVASQAVAAESQRRAVALQVLERRDAL